MKRIAICSSALVLSFLAACGGEAPTPSTPAGGNQPAPTPAQADAPNAQEPAGGAAAKKPQPPVKVDMMMVKALFGNDPVPPKVDNPSTPEKVELGRMLYHETSISKQGNISCNSCHDLAKYGVDNKPTSPGSDGTLGERNSPTTYNAFRQYAQFWDYRAKTVEEQSIGPVLNPIEHGIADEKELVAKLSAKPELVAAFQKAFPGGEAVTAANFQLAVGAFERTLVTKSRWDAFLDGDAKALTNEEKAGLNLFITTGCIQCHTSRLVGGSMPQKRGVIQAYKGADTGRMKVTGQESDKYFFKVPSLLNVEKTAPYYHDGSAATLADAIKEMAKEQLGKDLSDADTASLEAFLKSLTGELPAQK